MEKIRSKIIRSHKVSKVNKIINIKYIFIFLVLAKPNTACYFFINNKHILSKAFLDSINIYTDLLYTCQLDKYFKNL